MWPIIVAVVRTYAPYVVLPFAAVVGLVGYGIEGKLTDRFTPWKGSVVDRREQRMLEQEKDQNSASETGLKNPEFVPNNIFQKNQSPQLMKPLQ